METICIFPDEQERQELFAYLNELEIEYHKPYKRFNQTVKVPRGQASFTLHDDIHYNYKVSGGSPPNKVMCDTLRMITSRVNAALGTHFNTILMNVYRSGDDCIGYHRDNETGWAPNTGFATLCFGAERDFLLRHDETRDVTTTRHHDGHVIHLPHPMNSHYQHSVPRRKRVAGTRISLTFRQIQDKRRNTLKDKGA